MILESRTMQKYVNLIVLLEKLISKEHVVVIMKFPDWVQVKKIYYTQKLVLLIYTVSELNRKFY